MSEPVSPQRRRPPGWRAARPASEEGPAPDAPGAPGGADPAFDRGETVERPAVRLPAADDDTADHPVFGRARDEGSRDADDRAWDEADFEAGDEDADEAGDEAHPVAVPLAGFFTGMAWIIGLPVLYVWLSDPDSIADAIGVDLVWLIAAVLVPVFLTAIPQTRKFGRYMLLGVGLSALVVVGVAALVLAVLIFLT